MGRGPQPPAGRSRQLRQAPRRRPGTGGRGSGRSSAHDRPEPEAREDEGVVRLPDHDRAARRHDRIEWTAGRDQGRPSVHGEDVGRRRFRVRRRVRQGEDDRTSSASAIARIAPFGEDPRHPGRAHQDRRDGTSGPRPPGRRPAPSPYPCASSDGHRELRLVGLDAGPPLDEEAPGVEHGDGIGAPSDAAAPASGHRRSGEPGDADTRRPGAHEHEPLRRQGRRPTRRSEARMPAIATPAVPWMSSLKLGRRSR